MNSDIHFLLLKTQKEMYEQQLKNLEDTFIQNIAESYIGLSRYGIYTLSRYGLYTNNIYGKHNKFLHYICDLIDKQCDKKIILKILEMKGSSDKRVGTHISQNVAIKAIILDDDGLVRPIIQLIESVINELYKYIGEDFATKMEVEKYICLKN
jgi:hypothetical protein